MTPPPPDDLSRYHRQMLLPGIGEAGQRRLRAARVLIVGCGALGTVIADTLARGGVGLLRIIDRDLVEPTNLQRQVLFDESDADTGMPKAEAARRKLAAINRGVTVEAHVADFHAGNALALAEGVDLLLDGTDNFETRFLINDLSVKLGIPYVYGGAVGTTGMACTLLPRTRQGDSAWERANLVGPCLRCLFDAPPPAGAGPTCDTAGVLGPVVMTVAARQATEAIKLLTGHPDRVSRALWSIDVWDHATREMDVSGAQRDDCPCCGRGVFDYLEGDRGSSAVSLCGRNAVQVRPARSDTPAVLDLADLAARLDAHGSVDRNAHLLRLALTDERRITLFPDGRAIIHGTDDPAVARALYARYVGL